MASDVVIVVPKLDELETIAWAFGLDLSKPDARLDVGGFVYHRMLDGLRVCFAFMDGQDAVRAGLVTFEVLKAERPRYAFLVGTALGSDPGTPVGSVVVSSTVHYLVELTYDLASKGLDFGNPTTINSHGAMSPAARTRATQSFSRANLFAAMREAGDHLGCADEADTVIAKYKPKVLVEPVGSSNIYFRSPPGQTQSTQAMVFGTSSRFKLYDMESAGFARAAAALGVDWLVVRGISDYGAKISENVRRLATAVAGRCLSVIIPHVCKAHETVLAGYDYRVDGYWEGIFAFRGASGEITILSDKVNITQADADHAVGTVESTVVEGTFEPAVIHYSVQFGVFKLGHVAGTWTDGRRVEQYFGVMLAELVQQSRVMTGSWLGVSHATSARVGRFEWHNRTRAGLATDTALPSYDELCRKVVSLLENP